MKGHSRETVALLGQQAGLDLVFPAQERQLSGSKEGRSMVLLLLCYMDQTPVSLGEERKVGQGLEWRLMECGEWVLGAALAAVCLQQLGVTSPAHYTPRITGKLPEAQSTAGFRSS